MLASGTFSANCSTVSMLGAVFHALKPARIGFFPLGGDYGQAGARQLHGIGSEDWR